MTDLVVIVPSRGRPEAARALATAFRDTCTAAGTALTFAVDPDDQAVDEYLAVGREASQRVSVGVVDAGRSMVYALNQTAAHWATAYAPPPYAIGFMGDDHCPRTVGWDQLYLDALRDLGTGIVYGDDKLQGENLPTQCAMTTDIVRAVGHMAPSTLTHLYVDNYWRDLGQQAGCLRYLPDVIIEHRHPLAGTAEWDDGYRRVNNQGMYDRDQAAYSRYAATRLPADVATVRALRGTDG